MQVIEKSRGNEVGRAYYTTTQQPFQGTIANILTLHIVPRGHGGD